MATIDDVYNFLVDNFDFTAGNGKLKLKQFKVEPDSGTGIEVSSPDDKAIKVQGYERALYLEGTGPGGQALTMFGAGAQSGFEGGKAVLAVGGYGVDGEGHGGPAFGIFGGDSDATTAKANAAMLISAGNNNGAGFKEVAAVVMDETFNTGNISNISLVPHGTGVGISCPVEAGASLIESLKLANSANAGKTDGMAGTTVHLRDLADTKDRITATVDSNGNRSAITLDLS